LRLRFYVRCRLSASQNISSAAAVEAAGARAAWDDGQSIAADGRRVTPSAMSLPTEVDMNWDQVQGNWKQFRGAVKKQWGKLTDDELDQINGQREQLIGKIQKAYGISKEESEKQLETWTERQH
jgi:uncharacterized protein YjbJ (UPF0337 family)